MARPQYTFEYIIDISGSWPSDMVLGMISIVQQDKTQLYNDLSKEFPKLSKRRFRKQNLNRHELKNIMQFLGERGVHMTALSLQSRYIGRLHRQYGERKDYKERIMATAYFYLLQEKATPGHLHDVTVDEDNWMDVQKAAKHVNRVANANDYNFDITISHHKNSQFIKIADKIAYLPRKISGEYYSDEDLFTKLTSPIPQRYIDKVMS